MALIIPAFNAGAYLDQTLASVAGQTRPADVVVVADDCSGDDTGERARRWEIRLPIKVLRMDENVGPGPARHEAIRATDTTLLAIVDADDLLLPDHLETMIAAHDRAPGLVSAQELSWIPGRGIDLAGRRMRKRCACWPRGAVVDTAPAQLHQLPTLHARDVRHVRRFPRPILGR